MIFLSNIFWLEKHTQLRRGLDMPGASWHHKLCAYRLDNLKYHEGRDGQKEEKKHLRGRTQASLPKIEKKKIKKC